MTSERQPVSGMAQVVASAIGVVIICLMVTSMAYSLVPTDSFAVVAVVGNCVAVIFAIAAWTGVLWKKETELLTRSLSPREWISIFFIGLAVSAVFVFIDCGWHIPLPHEKFVCDGHPGISLVFTIGAAFLTIISLPSAVRAYLLQVFSRTGGEGAPDA